MGNSNDNKSWIYLFATGLFFLAIIGSVPQSVKIHSYDFLGGILIPAGTVLFSMSYLATDVLCELYGRGQAFRIVMIGLLMRVFLVLTTYFTLFGEDISGISNSVFWSTSNDEAYDFVMGSSQLIVIGGIVGLAISSFVDVTLFSYFKKAHEGKNLLWLRNNVSTMIGQLVGTVVFVTIAFSSRFPMEALYSMVIGQVMFKILIAILDTPILYILRNLGSRRPVLDFSG